MEWLRPRLPMAWILNQAFLGQLSYPTTATAAGVGGEDDPTGGRDDVEVRVGRGLAMAWVSAR